MTRLLRSTLSAPRRQASLAAALLSLLLAAAVAVSAPMTAPANQPNAAAAEMEPMADDAVPAHLSHGADDLVSAASLSAVHLPAKGVIALTNDAYGPAVVELIERAESDVTLMLYQARYYADYPDSQPNYFAHALFAALDRGVSVNLLLDVTDWKGDEENDKNVEFARLLVAKGARVRFDPADKVSHQKVVVVDGKASIVSSHNWSFYSTDKNSETAVLIWSDQVANALIDVFEALDTVGADFDEKAETPEGADLSATGSAAPPAPGESMDAWLAGRPWLPVDWVTVAPNREYYGAVAEAIRGAKTSIDIAQNTIEHLAETPPYAYEDRPKDAPLQVNAMVDDLVDAAKRGVKVRAVLDWSDERGNDKNIKAAGILRRAGAKSYYDDGKRTLHSKMLVIDGETCVIGSTNWTFNAVEQGNELSVLVHSKGAALAFTKFVDDLIANGRPAAAADIPPMTESY